MNTVRIINPAAGKGKAIAALDNCVENYSTQSIGDTERFIKERCLKEPGTKFVICGGDGTISEAVNGILSANAGDSAKISIIPLGTGNDLKRYKGGKEADYRADVIRYNGRYLVNELNIGFDCKVVQYVNGITKRGLLTGSGAYIAGVVKAFFGKLSDKMEITIKEKDGNVIKYSGDYMLCVAANGQYYGGGFCPAPLADITDGLIDGIVVSKMSRLKFIQLISIYKKGAHIDENGEVVPKFKKYIHYHKCTEMSVTGMNCLCADGEIYDAEKVDISIVPSAINITI